MDIDMPVLDGYATTRIIREWQAERGVSAPTPIVALSAHDMREAVLASLEAGCVAHVAKPVDRATLLRTIRQYARSQALDPASRAAAAKLAPGVAELVPRYLARFQDDGDRRGSGVSGRPGLRSDPALRPQPARDGLRLRVPAYSADREGH
jgi:DNA-binding response OmpR family regulator